MASRRTPVSVIIPAKNEAANLPRCLDHLRWADDVVIVDSQSTDETPAIAAAYGARVIPFAWNGNWPKKRTWTLRHADLKHDWVLMVDADEWIVPELAAEVAVAILSDSFAGYWINRKFMFMGGWLRHCGYYPSFNLRLLRRGKGEFEKLTDIGDTKSGDNEVHEHVLLDGEAGYLKHDMLHFAYPDIHTFVEKHNRYSNWEAAVQYSHHMGTAAIKGHAQFAGRRMLKDVSRCLPFRPTMRFLYHYFARLGVLDGRRGLIFCRLLAMYEFLSVAKHTEMKWLQGTGDQTHGLSEVETFDWRAAAVNSELTPDLVSP